MAIGQPSHQGSDAAASLVGLHGPSLIAAGFGNRATTDSAGLAAQRAVYSYKRRKGATLAITDEHWADRAMANPGIACHVIRIDCSLPSHSRAEIVTNLRPECRPPYLQALPDSHSLTHALPRLAATTPSHSGFNRSLRHGRFIHCR
jgi:hypothetical protein